MAEWYYTIRGRQQGPVSAAELQELAASGKLRPSDLVWKAGLADWIEARERAELFPDRAGRPSPRRREPPAYDDFADDDFDDRPPRRARGLSTGAWVAILGTSAAALALVIVVVVLLLNLGGSSTLDVTDELTLRDPVDTVRRGCRCKAYTVRLEAGRTYTIDMVDEGGGGIFQMGRLGLFDPFLRLEESATGRTIASNDDGPFGLNSRIVFNTPRTGDYRVVATTLGPGQIGRFRLTVREGMHRDLPGF